MMRLVLLAVLALSACQFDPAPPAPTIADPSPYEATLRCPDGMPAVVEGGCSGAALQRSSDVMLWRRADTSGHSDGQIEDAFLSDDGSAVNTFSYPPHGPFVAGNGDGGDVLTTDSGTVRISFTQNGTPGGGTIAGYWVGPDCGGTGWVEFRNDAPTGSWASMIAALAGSADPNACPSLNPSYTQYRLETLSVPFILPDGSTQTVSLPCIISEHYAGPSISASSSMERVILAQNVGRIVWEAWAKAAPVSFQNPGIAPFNGPPDQGWGLQDRRVLNRLVPGTISGKGYGWP